MRRKIIKHKKARTASYVADFSEILRLHQRGDLAVAKSGYSRLLVDRPDDPECLHLLGVVHLQEGDFTVAEPLIRAAIARNAKAAPYWNNLGEVLRKTSRIKEARECFARALALNPNYADAHNNLGNCASIEGDDAEAVAAYEEATNLNPSSALGWYNLGSALSRQRRFESAVDALQRALRLVPSYADAWNNLGLVYGDLEQNEQAQAAFESALRSVPDHADAQANLGNLLMNRKEFARALPLLESAYSKKPKHERLRVTFAMLQATVGEVDRAAKLLCDLNVDELKPEEHSNILFVKNYDPSISLSALRVAYADWGARHAVVGDKRLPPAAPKARPLRLKIGYISGDFCNHAVRYFLEPVLDHHDHNRYEIFAYSNVLVEDEITPLFRGKVDTWRDIARLSDEEVALIIRRDGIDVLVDLAGHTAGNRLRVFAYRPATVQVSWLGYGCTTGVSEIDYFIGDDYLTPTDVQPLFTECLYRLPRPSLAYRPPLRPLVTPLPCLTRGIISFGCLSRLIRLNDQVINSWAAILNRVPNSRLYLDQPILEQDGVRDLLTQRLIALGIPSERLVLGWCRPHWGAYQQEIDIALDPFPHNAGTTTFEALWMGVPVISLRASSSMGRYGDMILHAIGRPEWVADDLDAYVAAAVDLASNRDYLQQIRASLRSALENSPLMDESGLCRAMESAYSDMWVQTATVVDANRDAATDVDTSATPDQLAASLERVLLVNQAELALGYADNFAVAYPDDHRASLGKGIALRQLGRYAEAIDAYCHSLALKPDFLPTLMNLARVYILTGNYSDGIQALRTAVKLHVASAEAHSLLSWALRHQDDNVGAELAAREAIRLDPDFADAWQNLGNALRGLDKSTDAANAYRRVLDLNPNNVDARTCLGSIIKDRALYPEAREVYEEGLRRTSSADDAIWTNYFFALNYDPYLSAEEIATRYRDWGGRTEAKIKAISSPEKLDKDPARKLRIGVVSADFFRHAIRFFVHPWLDVADRENFHWTLYSNTNKEDAETESFKQKADCWRDIRWKSDQEVLATIQSDGIDILIDLSGHTAGHKLFVFAAKPAPVQIAMLGTGYTTGLSMIDYFLADPRFVPPEASGLFTERIIRLPISPFVFQPEYPTLSVAELPAGRNGFVTFGCMSRMVRLNRLVIAAWIGILQRLPEARLRLDHPQVIDPETRVLLEQQFQEGGIDLARIDLLSTKPHWQAYDEIDIALDPFPHNAGTTTIEALWKGVPVLTLSGRPSLGRFGDTILNAVGLSDWVAHDVESYINKAVEQAGDLEKLALLRSHLRERVQFSPLMDGKGFALHLQAALRMAWQRYCSDAPESDFDIQPIERDTAWVNVRLAAGTTHLKKHELETAKFFFEYILKFNSKEPRTWLNLGACLRYGGQDKEGLACFEKAVETDPGYVSGWYNLGATQQAFKRFDNAEKSYLTVLSLDANHHEAWNNLGMIYKEAQRGNEALKCFRSALALCPDKASYLNNLGSLMERGDRLFEAKRLLERCLELEPNYLSANANLGMVYRKLALIDEAMAIQSRVVLENTLINHPLLFTANYHPDLSAQELYAVYETTCQKINALPRMVSAKPQRKAKLRVGFVGADFRAHAASKFLLPLFQYFKSDKTEFVILANQARMDAVSGKFQQCAQWINVYEMNDAEFIDCVQQENIDVLIDVAGWTNGSRLVAMAQKPAAVQISWLGYGYTTGLRSIDWFLGAPRFTPSGCAAFFSEKIFNLPCVPFCFDGISDAPEVNVLPALSRGGVTFGCLSRTVRLNHRVIKLWAEILLQIPQSRLVLDSKPFEDDEVCAHFHSLFQQQGVESERVILRNSIPHWQAYHDIDISLDPFPHNAGTTTIESLAMGVPVISLRDRPSLGRFGDVILGAVGLDEWVVDTEGEYVDHARRIAGGLQGLADLRQSLRARLLSSALCDYVRFARDFEAVIADIWERAVASVRVGEQLVQSGPNAVEMEELLAVFNQGNYVESEIIARAMTERFPLHGFGWKVLGGVLKLQGVEALEPLRKAAELLPRDAEAHSNFGAALKEQGQFTDAEACYRRALEIKPNFAEAYSNLGNTLREQGRLTDAEAHCRRALEINPSFAEALSNLGAILQEQGRLMEAEASYRQAIEIKSDFAEAHSNLGSTLKEQGRLAEAEAGYRRALEIKPDFAGAHQSLSTLWAHLSDYRRVVAESDKALQIEPVAEVTWGQRLYALSYHPDLSAEAIYAEFVRWGDRFPDPVVDFSNHDRTPRRRLRVGYVSPDFRRHTSHFYFWPLFANHDHAVVELYAYSNVKKEDDLTEQFKGLFDHWRNIRGVTDQDVAQMIRQDKVDILVDCCNHMRDERLGVFTLKPAPIQVTWLGAAWTTGLKTVDYVFFDPYLAPEGTLSRETIVRLPHFFVAYRSREETADIVPPPCVKNGYLTFGYSGRTERLNHRTFRVWGEILKQIPDARLILDFGPFADPQTQAYYRQFMSEYGVDIQRVSMRKSANIYEGLNDIDILLDCFPHSGGTMLFDALWMGVPVLTLASRPPLGRIGTSLMMNLGLPEWVAQSEDEYLAKACVFADDSRLLIKLRSGMRERMQNSPVMDGVGFARGVEEAYREMWQRYCELH
ncbi:MAG: tetratricopeptide repeat protein [Methylobacter sp.]|nr:MAG: tetratricopeptide repeat protein [Methylobacter sp.]